jgi:hypothetical protein
MGSGEPMTRFLIMRVLSRQQAADSIKIAVFKHFLKRCVACRIGFLKKGHALSRCLRLTKNETVPN